VALFCSLFRGSLIASFVLFTNLYLTFTNSLLPMLVESVPYRKTNPGGVLAENINSWRLHRCLIQLLADRAAALSQRFYYQ